MDFKQIIKTRKSFRTFNEEKISKNDINKLLEYIQTIKNPYGIPVNFYIRDCEECGLSSPVIEGENEYVIATVPDVEHCEEAFGYSFEMMVLYAWSLGIGTTWIGGTLDRKVFENAIDLNDDELMMIVSPLGYPSDDHSKVDKKLRQMVQGDERFPATELFFDGDFNTPLISSDECLEAVRWAPSAANRQPWRVVKQDNKYHFYVRHTEGYSSGVSWQVQKIDLGIAICHFMCVTDGEFSIDNPGIEADDHTEYIATITCE
ncbi:nitroreductase family protein [Methanobrevibacter thaueri]|uniref:nitroreductase family protein n=1 Tax=Methanobrevibacter thaueri TaxID=190975 RepID=UPI0025ECB347|nr:MULTISPECIES: nitroreductase family protein [Methanobrevibacter]